MNIITVINFVLCVVIFIFGLMGWRRSGKVFPLYIAIAFGLFGLSHLAAIIGKAAQLDVALIVIRTVAYLIVAFAVYKVAFGSK
jgi:CHASE2 domain-containing sensor protein